MKKTLLFIGLIACMAFAMSMPVSVQTYSVSVTTPPNQTEVVSEPYAITYQATCDKTTGTKRGTKYEVSAYNTGTGHDFNFRYAFFDKNGGYIVQGDTLITDAGNWCTMYGQSFTMQQLHDNHTYIQQSGDTCTIGAYFCILPLNGTGVSTTIKIRQY